ncbi:MAG: response regulator [Polyangiaceae bacterium]
MSPEKGLSRESAVRAQEAIVRALTEELNHLDPQSPAAANLRAQLVEEAGRLAFRVASTEPFPEASARESDQASTTLRRPRILIVEDDDGTRTALARWLVEKYEVITARDGQEGFSLANTSRPDVILTDLWMPRVDGLAMVSRLRRAEAMRDVPVVFLTGQAEAERDRTGLSAVAVACLAKPIDLDALEQAICAALAQHSHLPSELG